MTYYAVRRGRKTGIYTSWDECKKQVDGFDDASYKKFDNKQDAYRFLTGYKNKTNYKKNMSTACLYVRGYYFDDERAYKCEAILMENGNSHNIEQYGFEHIELKETAGYILGLFDGIGLSVDIGIPELDVVCTTDIEAFPENNEYVIKLKSYISRLKSKIKVNFYQKTEWR